MTIYQNTPGGVIQMTTEQHDYKKILLKKLVREFIAYTSLTVYKGYVYPAYNNTGYIDFLIETKELGYTREEVENAIIELKGEEE